MSTVTAVYFLTYLMHVFYPMIITSSKEKQQQQQADSWTVFFKKDKHNHTEIYELTNGYRNHSNYFLVFL